MTHSWYLQESLTSEIFESSGVPTIALEIVANDKSENFRCSALFCRPQSLRDVQKKLNRGCDKNLLPPSTKSYPERRHWKINFENAMTLMAIFLDVPPDTLYTMITKEKQQSPE